MTPAVHDLVRLDDGTWAVVRRAREEGGVAIGVRGEARSQRRALVVDRARIGAIVTPEAAAAMPPPRAHRVFTALQRAREAASALHLTLGVTGACGYELVTRDAVLHDESDLDIVIRAAFDDPRLAEFAFSLREIDVRLDVEVLLDDGCGAALVEVLRGGRVLVKTPDGPAVW